MAAIATGATTVLPPSTPTAQPLISPKPPPSPSSYARLLHTHTTIQLTAVLLPTPSNSTVTQPTSRGRRQPRSPASPVSPPRFDAANMRIPEAMAKRGSVASLWSCGSGVGSVGSGGGSGTVCSPMSNDGVEGDREGTSDGDVGSSRRGSGVEEGKEDGKGKVVTFDEEQPTTVEVGGMWGAWKESRVRIRAYSPETSPGSGKFNELGVVEEGVDAGMGWQD